MEEFQAVEKLSTPSVGNESTLLYTFVPPINVITPESLKLITPSVGLANCAIFLLFLDIIYPPNTIAIAIALPVVTGGVAVPKAVTLNSSFVVAPVVKTTDVPFEAV